jgi:ABC-type nitrate/sulfonate/bicarbonate transport system substrate-binding protein
MAGVALGGTALLGACGSTSSKTAGGTSTSTAGGTPNSSLGSKKLTSVKYRLDWIDNFEFSGSYLADSRGYYRDEGLSVTLEPSGPTTSIEPQVVTGKDLIATSYSETVAPAILAGADLVIIGTIYQKAPYAMVSRANDPIHVPTDMYGKVIGVGPPSVETFKAFCNINGIQASKIKTVPVAVDPAPLAAGTIDGWLGYVMDEPSTLRSRGVAVDTMLFADFGFNLYEAVYIVTRSALENQRDLIKSFMTAEVRGWQDSIKDPSAGAELTVDVYGRSLGLNSKAQYLAAAAQNQIIVTNDPRRGILTLNPDLLDATIRTLAFNDINITKEKLYDLTLMEEVYSGKSSL